MKVVLRPLVLAASAASAAHYPTVTAHGMGDSCYNAGMKGITKVIGEALGSYARCVPTGNRLTDTTNGFFMTMDDNVDAFAAKVRADKALAEGFNCVGFSQGNSVCRGYVHRYNEPPVANFLSVHGTVSGVAGFPDCEPDGLLGPVCKALAALIGEAAYTPETQELLFQIDYYRDPLRVHSEAYKNNSQLAQWNNEGLTFNATYRDNFARLKRLIMIKAERDTTVIPSDGEHWGSYEDGSLTKLLAYNETRWYADNLFGLRTVDEAGNLVFNTTAGNHLEFDEDQLTWWVTNYFAQAPADPPVN